MKRATNSSAIVPDLLSATQAAEKCGSPIVLYSLVAAGKLRPRINRHRMVRFDRVDIETVLAVYRINGQEIEILPRLKSVAAAVAECERRRATTRR